MGLLFSRMNFAQFWFYTSDDDSTVVEHSECECSDDLDVPEENDHDFQHNSSGSQDFHKLRAQCLATGSLFEDTDFPASMYSLYQLYKTDDEEEVKWKRPKEIVTNPKFISDGFSRFDIEQGKLGNCWFLSACASLANVPELFQRVVPQDNGEFTDDNYAGLFHFRFWQYGQWVEVLIDDRLPVDENNRLLYVSSSTEDEFWGALLEKAYAKLHGAYDALSGGTGAEATVDLSGGITEEYKLKGNEPPELYDILERNLERRCLITAAIRSDVQGKLDAVNLVGVHAYSVTKVARLVAHRDLLDLGVEDDDVRLVCVRNPWGTKEWNGAWSDNSLDWILVSDEKINELNVVKEDGEFWMNFKDFLNYFDGITMCHPGPESLNEVQESTKGTWRMVSQHGEWVRGNTAGGSVENLFWRNPQYLITIEKRFSIESVDGDDAKEEVIIGLMQKYHRAEGRKKFAIIYSIFPVSKENLPMRPLPKSFFDSTSRLENYPEYSLSREIIFRFSLPVGTYVLVPHTWKPQQEAGFFIRAFSLGPIAMECLDQKIEISHPVDMDEISLRKCCKKSLDENFTLDVEDAIRCEDVQRILQRMFDLKLGKKVCRTLVHLYSVPTGLRQLQHVHLLALLHDIAMWRTTFMKFDQNNDGTMSTWELRFAFAEGGMRVNGDILNTIIRSHKYRYLTLAEFIVSAIESKKIIEQCARRHYEHSIMMNMFSRMFAHLNDIDLYDASMF